MHPSDVDMSYGITYIGGYDSEKEYHMKKWITLAMVMLMVLIAAATAGAQTKKGTWTFGADVGSGYIESTSSEYSNSSSSNISKSKGSSFGIGVYPMFGYFIADNIAIGASLSFSFSSGSSDSSETASTATSTYKSSSTYVFLGPFFRFYFGGAGSKGLPYLQVGAGVSLYPSYSGDASYSSGSAYHFSYKKYTGVQAEVELGYEHFLNPSIGIKYYVGYSYNHYDYSYFYDYVTGTDYTYNSKSSYGSINFGVGLQIYLGPKN
jgi:hypothetical protein